MQDNVTFQAFNGAEDKINGTKIQFIPAKIEIPTSAKAAVHTYFDQYTEELDGELSNALRGHPLNGRKCKTPEGLLGVVYEENKTKLSETNRTLKVNSVFDEYIYWNYDKIPSSNDALVKGLDWMEIAKSFMEPLDPDRVAEFAKNRKVNGSSQETK
ncbi:hypothetical protein Bhyg_15530 [Pseudolycoriella hygida]|uniref:Uncharacterized protein n=1 Tax=Pseudolycoriella hygida TaxID=35572 RepID=A0A9Q0RTZ1_9DIPT|nr:hypothetical protein Bhyg_15530 [Pseudolycoriella hygida]